MSPDQRWAVAALQVGVLVDTNLLVLLVVGGVNRNRIEQFKRTQNYSAADYDLLTRVVTGMRVYTLTHLLSEVSNLTDLSGQERNAARRLLRSRIETFHEPQLPSREAASNQEFERLGLTDAAILTAASQHHCAVLTDDHQLVLALQAASLPVLNLNWLREWYLGY